VLVFKLVVQPMAGRFGGSRSAELLPSPPAFVIALLVRLTLFLCHRADTASIIIVVFVLDNGDGVLPSSPAEPRARIFLGPTLGKDKFDFSSAFLHLLFDQTNLSPYCLLLSHVVFQMAYFVNLCGECRLGIEELSLNIGKGCSISRGGGIGGLRGRMLHRSPNGGKDSRIGRKGWWDIASKNIIDLVHNTRNTVKVCCSIAAFLKFILESAKDMIES
jgi:hypothetical protein